MNRKRYQVKRGVDQNLHKVLLKSSFLENQLQKLNIQAVHRLTTSSNVKITKYLINNVQNI